MQDAAQVVRRALVLAAVACRGFIEKDADEPDATVLHHRFLDWLTEFHLWNEAAQSEEALLRTPLGQMQSKDVIAATWQVEGLAVLAWAMKRSDLPHYDEQVNETETADAAGFLDDAAGEFIAHTQLRSPAELDAYRELMYAVHSRIRDFARNRTPKDFTNWVEQEWLDTLGLRPSHLFADKDLLVSGKPISEITEERLQELNSIIQERHRAIIWIVEAEENYAQVTADT